MVVGGRYNVLTFACTRERKIVDKNRSRGDEHEIVYISCIPTKLYNIEKRFRAFVQ